MRFLTLISALAVSSIAQAQPGSTLKMVYLADERPIFLQTHVRVSGVDLGKRWDRAITAAFKVCDTNSDGVISGTELTRLPDPGLLQELRPGGTRLPVPVASPGAVPKPDADNNPRDKKVTRDEFRAYINRWAQPISMTSSATARQYVYAGQVDNRDVGIRLFGMLDADGDGDLTVKELNGGLETLIKRDINDDESLSLAELGAGGGSMPILIRTNTGISKLPVLMIDKTTTPRIVAARVIAHYDRKGNRNRSLERDEVKFSKGQFADLDANDDGKLSRDEVIAWLTKGGADVEMAVNKPSGMVRATGLDDATEAVRKFMFGKKGGVASNYLAVRNRRPEFQKAVSVTGRQAAIVHRTNIIKLSVGGRPSRSRNLFQSPYSNLVARYDRDQNKYLDKTEARNISFLRDRFDRVDADGDGKIFINEILIYTKPLLGFIDAAVRVSVSDNGRDLFKLLDANGDRRLTKREFQIAAEKMKSFDRDGDGSLSAIEIIRELNVTFDRVTPNPNGAIADFAVYSGGVQRRPRSGPKWFRGMDRNADGDVSSREFLGAAETFRKLDADGNGLIDAKEAANAGSR